MKAKYIGDISNGSLELVEIDSYAHKTWEHKLAAAEQLVKVNPKLRLFDENKEMIGEVEMDEKTAGIFLIEKQKSLEKKEAELNKREQDLSEREAKLNEVPEVDSNTKVEKAPVESGVKHKAGRPKSAKK
jgi:hypothetical protein